MTKTLDELRQTWIEASAAYDRATYDYAWSELRDRDCDAVDNARRAMDVAWENYDLALKAHLDAMDEAARLKPATTEPTP